MTTVGRQLRDNAVALISLVVALGSLGYNTWRNERTEHNRNVRAAAFELLMKLADLKRVVFLAQYDRDQAGGNPRTGWTYVLAIQDLSKHLKVLERAGLIVRSRRAQSRPCRLEARPLREVAEWTERYRRYWERSFERLDAYLARLQRKERRDGRKSPR